MFEPMPYSVMKYQGGKFRLAKWVISHFPKHEIYVEPFGGSASVLMQKTPAATEVYNDLNSDVVNYFCVLRDPEMSKRLMDGLMKTPFSREEFDLAWEHRDPSLDMVERARLLYIRAQMSFSANGATSDVNPGFGGIKININGDWKHLQNRVFQKYPLAIELFTRRLRNTIIEHNDALKVIRQYDNPETLFYVDPPYTEDTWNTSSRVYKLENMSQDDLLDTLLGVQGMVVLSGYDNPLYNKKLKSWAKDSIQTINQANDHRIECLWINRRASKRIKQPRLFSL